jgi:polar amino acid transport system substrate-binding protein
VPIWVGFNRRYSQLAMTLREHLKSIPRPIALEYRVNAGPLTSVHWLRDPDVGGGRLIGEGCHFLDLMLFLLEHREEPVRPVSVQATAAPAEGSSLPGDNLVVAMRFDDGSVAALLYTASGAAALGKERLEVHGGGVSFVLDDFRSLTAFGPTRTPEARPHIRLRKADKGIRRQWVEIGKAMRGQDSAAITYPEVHRAMDLTFRVDGALRGGC